MPRWREVVRTVPELAGPVQARFEATGLGFLGTVRADGSPRVSGIEPKFWDGELWLGMMDGSLKARDLLREPRFSLHAASVDKDVKDGDARVSGRAVEVLDDAVKRAAGAAFGAESGFDPNDHGPFHLFRADVTEVMLLRPAGDHLDIDVWHPGAPPRRIERF